MGRPGAVQGCQAFSSSAPKSDIDSAAKFIGAGAATVGVAGSGAGINPCLIITASVVLLDKAPNVEQSVGPGAVGVGQQGAHEQQSQQDLRGAHGWLAPPCCTSPC